MNKQLLWPSLVVVWLLAIAGGALAGAAFIANMPAAPAEAATPVELAADTMASPQAGSADTGAQSDLVMSTDTPSPTPTDTATETTEPSSTPTPTSSPTASPTATATRPTSTPTRTFTPLPTRTPTPTPLPSGHSELQNNELASAAIVGKLDPSQPLPGDIADCRWQQPGSARLICHVQVYLPPGYFDGARRYPAVYLLHGWGGWDTGSHKSEWDSKYNIFTLADGLMRTGKIPPLIIVAPEGGHNYWFNHAVDGQRWGDYVSQELVNYIDSTFRTIPRGESRALGGLSMGGLGAMQLALNHPGEFDVIGLRSPTFRRVGDPDDAPFFGDANYYAAYDPFALVNRVQNLAGLSLYFISGDQDIWLDRTNQFRALLDQKQVHYDWHVYPGAHDAVFFGSHLEEELSFYGAHLVIK